jgi:UDP-N-acetylmuramoyl-L-alanyl-D-glutamate--2,6-diaminopimelate ligase
MHSAEAPAAPDLPSKNKVRGAMQLQMLTGDEIEASPEWGHVEISGLTADSREVQPGWLFAALPGAKADGARFVADAIAKGAVAVLVKAGAEVAVSGRVPVLAADEPRRTLALMAARFFAAQPDNIVAVTGTSGKTSVADFTRQIFAALGRKAASLGTIGLVKPDGGVYGGLTTPDPVTLHRTLAELAGEGFTHLAFEASSDGLAQHRLDGVKIEAAAFTNLGRDHLNTHHTVEAYRDAKLRLFTELLPAGGTAVLNADTRNENEELILRRASSGHRAMTVGTRGETLKLERVERDGFAQRLTVRHAGKSYDIRLPLIGDYQASNALLAAGLAIATGEAADRVFAALETLKGVKGRLEIAGELRGGLVVIDYAHKPDALIAALDALRPFAPGKLVCVFGCGGDRDKGKRPIMGQIAATKADTVIVTDDNPRSEKPEAIRAEILAGAPGAIEIGDRAEAIGSAVRRLGKGDVLLVAGKGHETGQIIGSKVLPFSDHDAVHAALAEAPIHV